MNFALVLSGNRVNGMTDGLGGRCWSRAWRWQASAATERELEGKVLGQAAA